MNKAFLWITLLSILGISGDTLAEEMDHFTDRLYMLENLKEASQEPKDPLNRRVNSFLKRLEKQLQSHSAAAKDPTQRYEWVADQFLHPIQSLRVLITPFANWIVAQSPVPTFYASSRGIYGGQVDYRHMLMAWYVKLVPIIRLHGVLQGTDKVGHFFGQGWMYFEHYLKLRQQNPQLSEAELLESIRKYGHETEMGTLGYGTGGVYSSADLASNWQGFIFFTELFSELSSVTRPYFIIKDDRYTLVRSFSWKDYITDEWDEVLLPSRMFDQDSYEKVVENFYRQRSDGGSICQDYLKNPKFFLNDSKRSLSKNEFLWSGIDHAHAPYQLDIQRICSEKSNPR